MRDTIKHCCASNVETGASCYRTKRLTGLCTEQRADLFFADSILMKPGAKVCSNHGGNGFLSKRAMVIPGKALESVEFASRFESIQPFISTTCTASIKKVDSDYWDEDMLTDGISKGILGCSAENARWLFDKYVSGTVKNSLFGTAWKKFVVFMQSVNKGVPTNNLAATMDFCDYDETT